MSKICPKCGYNESDDAKFCHICGQSLGNVGINEKEEFEYDFDKEAPVHTAFNEQETAQTTDDFEFDFGAKEQAQSQSFGVNPSVNYDERPFVATKIDNFKANRYKKEIFSWSLFILIAAFLGFILNLADLSEMQEVQALLPLILDEYYGMFSTAVNAYYAGVVVLALMIVVGIVLVVFAAKLNKFNFPVMNDDVFGWARKTFFVALTVAILDAVLCIIEVIAFANGMKMQIAFDDFDFNYTMNIVYIVKDFIVLGGMIATTLYCNKLANCKQN